MPRTSLQSKKVSTCAPDNQGSHLLQDTGLTSIVSYSQSVSPSGLGRCLTGGWLAGVALPDDTDAPGEIKAGTETVEDTKTKAKSKNSRARRLSYLANAEGVGPQVFGLGCSVVLACPLYRSYSPFLLPFILC